MNGLRLAKQQVGKCPSKGRIQTINRGGSRGRVQGVRTLPWDDLRFSNTTGILQKKKNYVVYWCWSRARVECTPILKKILDPPLIKKENNSLLFEVIGIECLRYLCTFDWRIREYRTNEISILNQKERRVRKYDAKHFPYEIQYGYYI